MGIIGGFLYLLLFLVLIGPPAWLAVTTISVILERWRVRRKVLASATSEDNTLAVADERTSIGCIGAAVGVIIPVLALVVGALFYSIESSFPAEFTLGFAVLICVWWWFRLRRAGVNNADVYGMAAMVFTYLGWSVMILLDGDANTIGTRWTFSGGNTGDDYGIENLFGGKTLAAVSAIWALVVTVMALVSTRLRRPPVRPVWLMLLALPYICVFWFTEAMGVAHMALAVAAIGYAISREVRREEDERRMLGGAVQDSRMLRASASRNRLTAPVAVAALTTVLTIAAGAALSEFASLDPAYRFAVLVPVLISSASVQYWILHRILERRSVWIWVTIHVVGAVSALSFFDIVTASEPGWYGWQLIFTGPIALVALIALAIRGKARQYGAMLLGCVFMLMVVHTYDAVGAETFGPPWTVTQFAETSVAAVATLAIMWFVFGPGANHSGDVGQLVSAGS